MSSSRLRVLWICGAAGAGKSATAWGLFEQLAAEGVRVAYVDIDQLGMLYPAVDDDPGWHHSLKAEALARLVPGYVAAGAQLLIVSGVVDPREGPAAYLPTDADLTLCLLSPGPEVLSGRILARGWGRVGVDEAVAEDAALLAAPFMDLRIDTSARSVAQTVEQIRDVVHVDDQVCERRGAGFVSQSGVDVLVVTGPRAVGSSTIGFGLARERWRAGRRTAFLDLQQLGFIAHGGQVGSESVLAIGQVAAMHDLMSERGAEALVVSAHLSVPDRDVLRAALPRAGTTVLRLRADEQTLIAHVRARFDGSEARLAADDLLAADQDRQDAVVAAASAEQRALDASSTDDAVVDVSGRTPAQVIAYVERLAFP